jgi:trehalose 6-phosphate synthase
MKAMSRVVVVSNRLPTVRRSGSLGEPEIPVGGLASAVFQVLSQAPGSRWFGWNGETTGHRASRRLRRHMVPPGVELVGIRLTEEEVGSHYHGFCNQTLWPLFHCFQGKVKIALAEEACYRRVQERFAAALRPLLGDGDLVWVHDYHLLLLGRELRRLGWRGRTGFFLHTPFPPHDLWQLLPDPRDFAAALLDYDLAGFHVPGFLDNYVYACRRELGARWDGTALATRDRVQRAGVYPVGIAPETFAPAAPGPGEPPPGGRKPVAGRRRRDPAAGQGRRLVVGVDRLDYTKGIPERILGFATFLREHPAWRRRVALVQIASPSRTRVAGYLEERQRVESVLGRVNGELGEPDWVPVRYLYRTYPRSELARLYRRAAVGLITPLRDGMNLVAKEYVAAQDPASPGVLVLSRSTGAAQELLEALLVNPYVPSDLAAGLARALDMPLDERQERHAALLARVKAATAAGWGRRFLADLAGEETRLATPDGLVCDMGLVPTLM